MPQPVGWRVVGIAYRVIAGHLAQRGGHRQQCDSYGCCRRNWATRLGAESPTSLSDAVPQWDLRGDACPLQSGPISVGTGADLAGSESARLLPGVSWLRRRPCRCRGHIRKPGAALRIFLARAARCAGG